jgi:hypothetical protein
MITKRGKPKYLERNLPQCLFYHYELNMAYPGTETCLCDKKPATNHLSYDKTPGLSKNRLSMELSWADHKSTLFYCIENKQTSKNMETDIYGLGHIGYWRAKFI